MTSNINPGRNERVGNRQDQLGGANLARVNQSDIGTLLSSIRYWEERVRELRDSRVRPDVGDVEDENPQSNAIIQRFDEINENREGYYISNIDGALYRLDQVTRGRGSTNGSTGYDFSSLIQDSLVLNTPESNSLLNDNSRGFDFNSFIQGAEGNFNSFIDNVSSGFKSFTNFAGDAIQSAGNAIGGFVQTAGKMLTKVADWFVSQIPGSTNTKEDSGPSNGNCLMAVSVMLGRMFGKLQGGADLADQQIEDMRKMSGVTMDESEGTTLDQAAKGLSSLGLNAEKREGVTLEDLKEGLARGEKFAIAVNPEGYDQDIGKDYVDGGHAVLLTEINGDTATLWDPGQQRPITISVASLMQSMSDFNNGVVAVTDPSDPNKFAVNGSAVA